MDIITKMYHVLVIEHELEKLKNGISKELYLEVQSIDISNDTELELMSRLLPIFNDIRLPKTFVPVLPDFIAQCTFALATGIAVIELSKEHLSHIFGLTP